MSISFEWDKEKNKSNQTKHGVSFETAIYVFSDQYQESVIERIVDGEERWQTIGQVGDEILLLVAHTLRSDEDHEVIRIISARQATPKERRIYESKKEI